MHEDDWLNPQKVIISHRRRWRRDEEIKNILEQLVSSAVNELENNNRNNSSNDTLLLSPLNIKTSTGHLNRT